MSSKSTFDLKCIAHTYSFHKKFVQSTVSQWRNILKCSILASQILCITKEKCYLNIHIFIHKGKGKGMSHKRSVRWGVPVRETLVLSHRLCEVGWPVPFLAAFISPVFPPGTHLLLGGQWVGNQPLALCWSRTVVFASGSKRSNREATRPPYLYIHVTNF